MRSLLSLALLAACAGRAPEPAVPRAEPAPDAIVTLAETLRVQRVADGVWMFTDSSDPAAPANGLLLATDAGSVLVDTGASDAGARALVRWADETLHRPITAAMVTSAEPDRVGGVPALVEHGISVFASMRTVELAAARGQPITASPIEPESIPALRWIFVRIAPRPERIVVWHAPTRTLYAGHTVPTDAEVASEPDPIDARAALDLTRESFPEALRVVPASGALGSLALLEEARLRLADCTSDEQCVVSIEELGSCACCRCVPPRALTQVAIERAFAERLSCDPICSEQPCNPCTTPEVLATLGAQCHRGECVLRSGSAPLRDVSR